MTGECFHLLLPGRLECFPHANGLLLSFRIFGQKIFAFSVESGFFSFFSPHHQQRNSPAKQPTKTVNPYSKVANKRACTFIFFKGFFQPACSYYLCTFLFFSLNFGSLFILFLKISFIKPSKWS